MLRITFETMKFRQDESGITGDFLRQFSFHIRAEDIKKFGKYTIENGVLIFPDCSEKKMTKFSQILESAMKHLTNRLTDKPVTYIHRNSGIPLIGNSAFGLVDRNTNIIEVKPITGCNIACVFCSVTDEKRTSDIVIEMEYLVQECEKLVKFKGEDCEIFINAHGEPTLYADLDLLIANLNKIDGIKRISMITNAMVLTPAKLDELVKAGLSQLNISINSIDNKKAKEIMGRMYHIKPVLRLIEHGVNKLPIVLAPVWVPGINGEDIEDLVKLTKSYETAPFPPRMCIQNFLSYRFGANPVKPKSMDEFYADLQALEKKHNIPLVIDKTDFKVTYTKKLPKPFNKGDTIEVELKCPGRMPKEMLAVAGDRVVSVFNCSKKSGNIKVKLIKAKHNIFNAILA